MSRPPGVRPSTDCVHAGRSAGPGESLVPPLVQSTTYAWAGLDRPPAVSYARSGNPTTEVLERRLAKLEAGGGAVCFTSGLAALDALVRAVPDGGRIVAGRHLYGGTTRLLRAFHGGDREVEFVDTTDGTALRTSLRRPTALVLVETPSNPTLRITDVRRVAGLAHAAGGLLAVDNTLLTPLYQRPLGLGADVVIHSTTKYIDGHDATLGGALVVAPAHAAAGDSPDGPLEARLRWVRKAAGTVLAPFEAWLTLQGVKTLHLRTRAQWSVAARCASVGQRHPAVTAVSYPGLPDHPEHAVHRRQARGDGGLVALDLGSFERAREFVTRLRVFTIAENLGATESIATHPASMTHGDLTPERRREDGIAPGLVRLSFGVEDPDDLEADLVAALDATGPAAGASE